MDKSIRHQYETIGVKEFYENHGDTYINPHSSIIDESFDEVFEFIYNQIVCEDDIFILDFACGDGIISSLISKNIKIKNYNNIKIDASDPFLSHQYIKKNQENFILNVFNFGFEDIIKNDIFTGCDNNFRNYYHLIIISFAIHLLDKKYIKFFLDKISYHTKYLLIISPTKNKGDFDDISNASFSKNFEKKINENEKKIFYKLYESNHQL